MPSAVQRAIASPAILAQILAQLSPGWNSVKDPDNTDDEDGREDRASLRSALAACTRVCRSFSGPALDTQWRVLDDVAVLLRILPHTVSHPGNDSGSEDGLDMNPARLNVLMKFRAFARRVRELNTAPPSYFIHPDVWNTLATRLQGTPLLPRLQRLHISMIYNDPTSFVLCLSPTLRHLSFQSCDDHGAPMVTNDELVQNILAVISAPQELPSSSCIQLARQALPECTEAVVQHLCSIGRLSHL
ncbi:hypothetical protein LXA43DRAFT_1099795 [Ganoderma leucocontextum]|nr:hypothetical protein LXA43DRAFT_1099795 [Ganoderma leucocontextum]